MWNTWSLDYFKSSLDIKRTTYLFLVPVIAIAGDTVIDFTFLYISLILKCFIDSATHFMIASLAWNYVENLLVSKRTHLFAVFTCGLFASGIDIDHFVAVGTINLQAATTLSHRPFFHCTTIFTAIALLLALFSIKICSIPLLKLSLMITIAVWTHHWRDGYRRGIWICPFGSTPSYGYLLYITGLIILPLGFHYLLRFTSELVNKAKRKHLETVYLV